MACISKSECSLCSVSCVPLAMWVRAGVELYMLPAIDMINHSTEPDKRNTLLRKSSAEMTVKVDGAPVVIHGFFTMKAGQCSACSHFNPYHTSHSALLLMLPIE